MTTVTVLKSQEDQSRFTEILEDSKTFFIGSVQIGVGDVHAMAADTTVKCCYTTVHDEKHEVHLPLQMFLRVHPQAHAHLLHYLQTSLVSQYDSVCNLVKILDRVITQEQWAQALEDEAHSLEELRVILRLRSPFATSTPDRGILGEFCQDFLNVHISERLTSQIGGSLEAGTTEAFLRALRCFLAASFANYPECYYWAKNYQTPAVALEDAINLQYLGRLYSSADNPITPQVRLSTRHHQTLCLLARLGATNNDEERSTYLWRCYLSMAHNPLNEPALDFPHEMLSFSLGDLRPPYQGLITTCIANFLLGMHNGGSGRTLPKNVIEPKVMVLRCPYSSMAAMILIESDSVTNLQLLIELSAMVSQLPPEDEILLHAFTFNNGKYPQCAEHSRYDLYSRKMLERIHYDFLDKQHKAFYERVDRDYLASMWGQYEPMEQTTDESEALRKKYDDRHPISTAGVCNIEKVSMLNMNRHYEHIQRSYFYDSIGAPLSWWETDPAASDKGDDDDDDADDGSQGNGDRDSLRRQPFGAPADIVSTSATGSVGLSSQGYQGGWNASTSQQRSNTAARQSHSQDQRVLHQKPGATQASNTSIVHQDNPLMSKKRSYNEQTLMESDGNCTQVEEAKKFDEGGKEAKLKKACEDCIQVQSVRPGEALCEKCKASELSIIQMFPAAKSRAQLSLDSQSSSVAKPQQTQ